MNIIDYGGTIRDKIIGAEATGPAGEKLELDRALSGAIDRFLDIADSGKVIFTGNGGSAAIASHMAVDLWKNGGLRAVCFNDPAQLTCLSNDLGYDKVFSAPVEVFAEPGDIFVAISSSGASPNMLAAAGAARDKGCIVYTFTGFRQDNPLNRMGDLNFFVNDGTYGIVETVHAALCHYIMDKILERCIDVRP